MNHNSIHHSTQLSASNRSGVGLLGKVVPKASVLPDGPRIRIRAPGAVDNDEPRIELIQQGNEVRGVEIQCCCGQTIRLEFVY